MTIVTVVPSTMGLHCNRLPEPIITLAVVDLISNVTSSHIKQLEEIALWFVFADFWQIV